MPPQKRVLAHSHARLGSVSPSLDSPTLFHTDSFRLTISAFGKEYHLHLRPNDHLIHSAARVNYLTIGEDGLTRVNRTEPLHGEKVRAYWGEVVAAEHSVQRMREEAAGKLPDIPGRHEVELGWARIVMHAQGDTSSGTAPVFEGAFEAFGDIHHIITRENYERNKHPHDPHGVSSPDISGMDERLVVFRDSDIMTAAEELAAADASIHGKLLAGSGTANLIHSGCMHDTLQYNTDPLQNPILRRTIYSPWYDPLAMLLPGGQWSNATMFGKRDDVAGGGTTSK